MPILAGDLNIPLQDILCIRVVSFCFFWRRFKISDLLCEAKGEFSGSSFEMSSKSVDRTKEVWFPVPGPSRRWSWGETHDKQRRNHRSWKRRRGNVKDLPCQTGPLYMKLKSCYIDIENVSKWSSNFFWEEEAFRRHLTLNVLNI